MFNSVAQRGTLTACFRANQLPLFLSRTELKRRVGRVELGGGVKMKNTITCSVILIRLYKMWRSPIKPAFNLHIHQEMCWSSPKTNSSIGPLNAIIKFSAIKLSKIIIGIPIAEDLSSSCRIRCKH